ncbi:glycosyltransferase family 2 protein [Confluentibacter flavum]|uniref:Glycosyltransferase 2-like domain-containing protein n=1 Tax=Confluentibacter flavum TaxID=1909700 RepID=A0A2N3HFM5_9FLAO|nr:glycosyltransferase family 2 protein [Confluentibacter flavum]PKQ43779.1 hypothetical protein CSW08_17465 [Confluentibacter flavum]
MKLSIIIPAYNVEEYIETCLTSCCNQDLQLYDFEIIVINDGSTDDTEKKVLQFVENHSNILLKSQKNSGLGASRNLGVALSKGKYIYFLDGDDYIARNTLGSLITLIEKHSLDVIGFKSKNVTDSNLIDSKHTSKDIEVDNIFNGIDFMAKYNYMPEVWSYITKRSFYLDNKFNFYNRKFLQDSYFTPKLISKAKRIALVDYDVYRYRKSINSVTRNKSMEHAKTHMEDMCFAIHKLEELKNELISQGITNKKVLQRMDVKQQHYVFILISRFVKSDLDNSMLKKILSDFKLIGAYPLIKFLSTSDYKSNLYHILTFVYNRKYLLYPSIKIYRLLKR